MSCFGEYMAECAGDGVDITAPVPQRLRARCPARVMADEYATHLAGEETTETERDLRIGVCAPEGSGHSPATTLEGES